VTAALEVEAHSYDHEWKSEDEDTIRLIAHVSGSVLDMIDNIKLQVITLILFLPPYIARCGNYSSPSQGHARGAPAPSVPQK
jgi:hypothetical protein